MLTDSYTIGLNQLVIVSSVGIGHRLSSLDCGTDRHIKSYDRNTLKPSRSTVLYWLGPRKASGVRVLARYDRQNGQAETVLTISSPGFPLSEI